MFVVISKCRKHNLSTDSKLDMFDKVIKPIPSYGLEVWGYYNNKLLEKLQLKFCKLYILDIKTSRNVMVCGELCKFPLIINVKVRMISFRGKLVHSQNFTLPGKLLSVLRNLKFLGDFVQNILIECRLTLMLQETK